MLIVVQCIINSLAMFEVRQKFKPYLINKLIVKYAKHIEKRKTEKRTAKNIESMKHLMYQSVPTTIIPPGEPLGFDQS